MPTNAFYIRQRNGFVHQAAIGYFQSLSAANQVQDLHFIRSRIRNISKVLAEKMIAFLSNQSVQTTKSQITKPFFLPIFLLNNPL